MLEGGKPTIFDMFLNFGQMTEALPRNAWLSDPIGTTNAFMSRVLNADSIHPGAQKSVATQVLVAGPWAAVGYVTLDITHRLAATLMATKIDQTVEKMIVPPFPGVVVKLPDNLLFLEDANGNLSSCSLLGFSTAEYEGVPCFSYTMFSQSTTSVFGTNVPIVGFVTEGDRLGMDYGEVEAEDIDMRSSEMARKLIVGLCLYLSDPSKLGEPRRPKSKKPAQRNRAPGQLPQTTTYVIGREIELDSNVIVGIREYVKHGRKAPAVQYIVSGHWKMQAYGPGRAERKLIRVEPYWRGPVDAPILKHSGGGDGGVSGTASQIPAWLRRG
jgi:hypothetical protein